MKLKMQNRVFQSIIAAAAVAGIVGLAAGARGPGELALLGGVLVATAALLQAIAWATRDDSSLFVPRLTEPKDGCIRVKEERRSA